MSLPKKKDVPQLVKKYRSQYPDIDRDLLRKLIRLENNITNPSELKKLDRYLGETFKNHTPLTDERQKADHPLKTRLGFLDYFKWRKEFNARQEARKKQENDKKIERLHTNVEEYRKELKRQDEELKETNRKWWTSLSPEGQQQVIEFLEKIERGE